MFNFGSQFIKTEFSMFVEMVPSLLKKSSYFIWHYIFFKSENYNLQTVNLIQQTGIVVDQLLRNHDKVNFVLVLHRYRVFELRASVLTSSGSGALSQELHQGFISQTTCLYNYSVFRQICRVFFTMTWNPSLAYICYFKSNLKHFHAKIIKY